MSRKEITSVIIDYTAAMYLPYKTDESKTNLEIAFDCLATICEQKLLYNPKTHEVGLFVYNKTTQVLKEHYSITVEFVQSLESIRTGLIQTKQQQGDVFASIAEAIFVYNKNNKKTQPPHRIFVFTSLEGCTTYSDDAVHDLTKTLRTQGIKTNFIVFNTQGTGKTASADFQRNRRLVDIVLSSSQSACFDSSIALQLYSELKAKTHMLVTKFKGTLQVSKLLKITVCSYSKTTQENLSSLKKCSRLIEEDDGRVGTGEVKTERTFHEYDDPQMNPIPKDNVIKGFYYGRQLVPIPEDVKKEMKVVDEKQLRILGFSDMKKIPRHFLLTGSDIIVPTPKDDNIAAFNALVDALIESKKVGIVRYIMRNNTPPKLAAVFPDRLKDDEGKEGLRCLYLSQLPTAEDIRDYRFSKLEESTDEQRSLVEEMIEKMDLMRFKKETEASTGYEILDPEDTFNPVIQFFDRNLIARGIYGENNLLARDEGMMEDLHPERVTHKQTEDIAKMIKEMFGLTEKEISKVSAKSRLFWRQLINQQREAEQQRVSEVEQAAAQKMKLNPDKGEEDYVKDISMIHPVSDFNEMRKNKKHDLVDIALKKMCMVIERLVQESIKGSHFEKAIECLAELRRGCLDDDEVDFFNQFLRKLKEKYRDAGVSGIWRQIVRQGISLISVQENKRSTVSEEESLGFLEREEKEMKEKHMDEEDMDDMNDIE
jgi:ATP-dependent DNA helicase 2 subunit 2